MEENKERDLEEALDWNNPAQKSTPLNWSIPKKIFHTAVPCLLAFEITFGTSIISPSTTLLVHKFHVSRTAATLPLSLYTAGIAFGPLFIAPLSETLGRRKVYIITLGFLLAFTGGAGAAQNFGTLLVCRFLSGFFGSAGVAMGAGTIADLWPLGPAGGVAALFFILGPFMGPTFGPLAGTYILRDQDNDWRWTMWLLLMVGAPIWIGTIVMRETSHDRIRRVDEASPSLKQILKRTGDRVWTGLKRPTRMLFTESIILWLSVYTAFAYATVFSYFFSSTYVLELYYGFTPQQVGLSFISVVIGYMLASLLFGIFDKTLFANAPKLANGMPAPEHRLYSALVGSVLLPIGLFGYAWEAHRGGHWASLVASGIPFGMGAFSIFLSSVTYMVDVYKARAAASALAANGALRYTLGAVFPLFTLQMYEDIGVHWAGSIFAFISLALLIIPWLLFRFGKNLRARSKLASAES